MNECTVVICTTPGLDKSNVAEFFNWVSGTSDQAPEPTFTLSQRVIKGEKRQCDTYIATCESMPQQGIINYWSNVELEDPEGFALTITNAGKTRELTAAELTAA